MHDLRQRRCPISMPTQKKTSGTFVGTVRQDPGRKVFERPWWQQPARLSPSRERAPNKANYVSRLGSW
jgi:hypothetical protein